MPTTAAAMPISRTLYQSKPSKIMGQYTRSASGAALSALCVRGSRGVGRPFLGPAASRGVNLGAPFARYCHEQATTQGCQHFLRRNCAADV
jgi:hypothetical protein